MFCCRLTFNEMFRLAPTETTLNDFLRMIFQLRIQSIVMVTRLFEDGKVRSTKNSFDFRIFFSIFQNKSAQYWPDEGEKRVQDFRIRLENEEKYADFTIRRLIITNPSEVCRSTRRKKNTLLFVFHLVN